MKKVFLDCGSNIGQAITKFTKTHSIDHNWEVHMFEPNPRCYEKLSQFESENATLHRNDAGTVSRRLHRIREDVRPLCVRQDRTFHGRRAGRTRPQRPERAKMAAGAGIGSMVYLASQSQLWYARRSVRHLRSLRESRGRRWD